MQLLTACTSSYRAGSCISSVWWVSRRSLQLPGMCRAALTAAELPCRWPAFSLPLVFLQTDTVDRPPLCNNMLSLKFSHLADVLPLTRTLYKSVWGLSSHEKPQFIRSAHHFARIVFQSHLCSTCVLHLFSVVRGNLRSRHSLEQFWDAIRSVSLPQSLSLSVGNKHRHSLC